MEVELESPLDLLYTKEVRPCIVARNGQMKRCMGVSPPLNYGISFVSS